LLHASPQPPQCSAELLVSTHAPSDSGCPAEQPQEPFWHIWPPGQASSQDPQWFALVCVSPHEPVHSTRPGSHSEAQDACDQTCPTSQASLQPPQWLGLQAMSTQASSQAV